MDNPDALAWLHALCALRPRIATLKLRALLNTAGFAENAWRADAVLLRRAGWNDDAIAYFDERHRQWDVASEWARLSSTDVRLVPQAADEYPPLLHEIYDQPLGLYVRGAALPSNVPVAFVGSRKATPYGRSATHALARPLAARGVTIVSGLAYGIDAEAHRAALAVHGRTVAVLGSGVDEASLYPRAHRDLAMEIVSLGGAVISEYPPGTAPRPEYFPQRNRVIAGLARAVVVVEAGGTSGALITARLALSENRDVLAVPGPITSPLSEGTNRLLREGAAPALSADDVLEALALEDVLDQGKQEPRSAEASPLDPELAVEGRGGQGVGSGEHVGGVITAQVPTPNSLLPTPSPTTAADHLLALLSREPRTIDALVSVSTLPTHEVIAALSILELDGRVRDVGGKNYVRV